MIVEQKKVQQTPVHLKIVAASAQAWVESSKGETFAIVAENYDGEWTWFTQHEMHEFMGGSWQPRYRVRFDPTKGKAVFTRVRGS